jgi:hypothetical protein
VISREYIVKVLKSHFIKTIPRSDLSLNPDRNGHMMASVRDIIKNKSFVVLIKRNPF